MMLRRAGVLVALLGFACGESSGERPPIEEDPCVADQLSSTEILSFGRGSDGVGQVEAVRSRCDRAWPLDIRTDKPAVLRSFEFGSPLLLELGADASLYEIGRDLRVAKTIPLDDCDVVDLVSRSKDAAWVACGAQRRILRVEADADRVIPVAELPQFPEERITAIAVSNQTLFAALEPLSTSTTATVASIAVISLDSGALQKTIPLPCRSLIGRIGSMGSIVNVACTDEGRAGVIGILTADAQVGLIASREALGGLPFDLSMRDSGTLYVAIASDDDLDARKVIWFRLRAEIATQYRSSGEDYTTLQAGFTFVLVGTSSNGQPGLRVLEVGDDLVEGPDAPFITTTTPPLSALEL